MNSSRRRKERCRGRAIRLDLACGQHPRDGFEGVDRFAKRAKWPVDLVKFPWPWADGTVDELYCSHFLEHIPMDCDANGKDLLVRFMDEAWRIMKVGAKFTIVVPNARSNRAFQDPTHRRFFVSESFLYFNRTWRIQNGLDHYLGKCDFKIEVKIVYPVRLARLSARERQEKFEEHWNSILDWIAILTKVDGARRPDVTDKGRARLRGAENGRR